MAGSGGARGSGQVRARPRSARAIWLGRRAYRPVLALQRALQQARRRGRGRDTVLLLEHQPVITLGRGAKAGHLLLAEDELARRGLTVEQVGRGGDVTYHGPGQLVVYPIVDLRPDRCDVRAWVRALAEAMILLCRAQGVEAGVVDGMVGVWADATQPEQWAGAPWAGELVKVGAIGVRITRWVTMHGFALNLCTPPAAFEMIVPCGIRDRRVASVASLAGSAPEVCEVALGAAPALSQALGIEIDGVEDGAGAGLDPERIIGAASIPPNPGRGERM